jgi:hypothetical protein
VSIKGEIWQNECGKRREKANAAHFDEKKVVAWAIFREALLQDFHLISKHRLAIFSSNTEYC